MKPEIQWPLYFCDHTRFCRCPLKDEVQVSLAVFAIAATFTSLALVLAI
jgi:hypothetical protein